MEKKLITLLAVMAMVFGLAGQAKAYKFTTLDYPEAIRTWGFGINDSGIVVGEYKDGSGNTHGFVYDSATGYTPLNYTGAVKTVAYDGINDSGVVVGWYMDSSWQVHGFTYDSAADTPYTTLDYPGAYYSYANGINDSGNVVGEYSYSSYSGKWNSFVYDSAADTYATLDVPGAYISYGKGINDSGDVVGYYRDSSGLHGFIALAEEGDPTWPESPGSTPTGEDVVVEPVDSTTGEPAPLSLSFDNVTEGGETTVTSSTGGAPPPSGYKLGNPPVYYDISTTATFEGQTLVCIGYSGNSFNNESKLTLFHEEGTGWVDITCTPGVDGCPDPNPNTVDDVLCGITSSFSMFTLAERDVIEVEIDIKPGSYPNSINLATGGGVIPVAILTTPEFDASTVDTSIDENTGEGRISFSGASAKVKGKSGSYSSLEDVDGDGDLDLVVHFYLTTMDSSMFMVDGEFTYAEITGVTTGNAIITGMDEVVIVKE